MRVPRWAAVLTVVGSLLGPISATADEAELQQRLEQLEEQQKKMMEEMQRLRQELEKAKAEKALQPKPVEVAPAPVPVPAPAAAAAAPAEDVKEVQRRQVILTEEVRRLREMLVLPENKQMKSYYGLGPAASKVYEMNPGLSIGGYGEANYGAVLSDKEAEQNRFDFVRFVLYVGYKFNDWIVLNSEIEFEHATTEESVSSESGSVNVEFATLDFLLNPMANVRGGLILLPVGFINMTHEPPFYFGNTRPPVETQIIPTTWSANGAGLYGTLIEGLTYQTYGLVSLNAKGFTNENIRDARQGGNNELANDWSWVARLDYTPINEVIAGGSVFLGNQGQGELYGNDVDGFLKPNVFTNLWEAHVQAQYQGAWFRLLGTTAHFNDAAILSRDEFIEANTDGEPIASNILGIYTEVAYDVMPWILDDTAQYLAPWFRYSWLDTQNNVPAGFVPDKADRRWFYEFGLQYKPIPQIVLKLDYHIEETAGGPAPDVLRIGGGFIF